MPIRPNERPRIGVSRWENVLGERIAYYRRCLRRAGGEPVDLYGPRGHPAHELLEGLSGVVLTGGADIDPSLYGQERHPRTKRIIPRRDACESALVRLALERDLPVLAICRGHQLLNVALGGGLLQHIEGGHHRADYRSEGYPSRWHAVRLERGGRLAKLFGSGEVEVNSRHHQAVLPETVAPGLTVSALTPDGIVEGLESPSHRWVVGVQWHAERPEPGHNGFNENSRLLFEEFVRQAATAQHSGGSRTVSSRRK